MAWTTRSSLRKAWQRSAPWAQRPRNRPRRSMLLRASASCGEALPAVQRHEVEARRRDSEAELPDRVASQCARHPEIGQTCNV